MRQGPKQFGNEMPEILFVIDNDYEQRYYRSPEAMAKGVCGWLDENHGRIHAYRLIDEGFNPDSVLAERNRHDQTEKIEFNKLVGPQGYQPQAPGGPAAWTAWNKVEKKLHEAKVAAVAAILARVR